MPDVAEKYDLADKESVIRALVAVTQDREVVYVALPEHSLLRRDLERGYPASEMLSDVEVPDVPGLYYFEGVHWTQKTADTWQGPGEWDSGIRDATWTEQVIPHLSDVEFPNTD